MNLPITSTTEETRDTKRTKLSEPEESTITSFIESDRYTNIQEVTADVEIAASTVISKLHDKLAANNELRLSALSRELRAEIERATALKKNFDSLILREIIQRPLTLALARNKNGATHKLSSSEGDIKRPGLDNDNTVGTPVLTLYGSAPQPKQLFSSLQQPVQIVQRPSGLDGDQSPLLDEFDSKSSNVSKSSIREHALPIGISITKVVPVHSTNSSEEKKKVPTIGELFAPPATLAPLNPPRQSRHTATRSSSINWLSASESSTSNRPHQRNTYPTQPLSTGQWLTYNIAPSTQLSSPGARRKQRDRALSFGEPQPPASEETVASHIQAKEDALFRSVYSSFAPDRDNSEALVPEYTKNRTWWKRVGENQFYDSLTITQPDEIDGDASEGVGEVESSEVALDDEFDGVVENWIPENIPPELQENKESIPEILESREEVEEILQGISELLETLNSYQRVRNLSLANTARTGASSQLTAMSGSPTSPSPAEFDVYSMLKSQLALMVSTLPPYALAKLDGDKLGLLNISTNIQIKDTVHMGMMEEDEISAKTKQIVPSPATTYPSRPVNASAIVPPRSNGYVLPTSTPTQSIQRSSYTQPKPTNTPASYLPNQQYSSRPASSNHYFSGTAHTSYSSQRPVANSERYSYSASQQYSQRPAQSSHSQFQNGYRAYPPQNGTSYSQQYSSPQPGASSISPQPPGSHSQRPSQPGYQQRAMNSQAYGYGNSSIAKEPSPSKPNVSYSPQPQRTPFVGSSQTPGPPRPQLYHQHSSQFGAHTPSRQANGAGATPPAGQHSYMTADEQSALMNRQKAQLAEQQKSSSRQGSGTPQPTNGNPGGQQNGTPAVQPNGVLTG